MNSGMDYLFRINGHERINHTPYNVVIQVINFIRFYDEWFLDSRSIGK